MIFASNFSPPEKISDRASAASTAKSLFLIVEIIFLSTKDFIDYSLQETKNLK